MTRLEIIMQEYMPHGLRVMGGKGEVPITFLVRGVAQGCILTPYDESNPHKLYTLNIKSNKLLPVLKPLDNLTDEYAAKLYYISRDKLIADLVGKSIPLRYYVNLVRDMWDVHDLHNHGQAYNFFEVEKAYNKNKP